MKKPLLLSLLAIGLSAAVTLPAQSTDSSTPQEGGSHRGGHGGRWRAPDPEHQTQALTKRLNLSSDQQSQVKTILTDRNKQVEDLRADTSSSREDKMAKMKSIQEDSVSKINAVLNDDQKAKYKELQDQMRERMSQRKGRGPAADGNAPQ